MVVLRNFWTPCYWYDDIQAAAKSIAFYTAMSSLVIITYTAYLMNGGESSQFYMPYFETDRYHSTQIAGSLAIIFFLLFFFASGAVVKGIEIENRALMLPWMIGMTIIIAYQFIMGIHWLFNYYIYLESVLLIICTWLWMSYNIYCLLTITANYQIIKEKQSPNFIVLYE